jgi:hypothetical protein
MTQRRASLVANNKMDRLLAVLNQMFTKDTATNPPRAVFRDEVMRLPDADFRRLLKEILLLGFSRKQLVDSAGADTGLYSLVNFAFQVARDTSDAFTTRLFFGWRGERRTLQQIHDQGGCQRKIDLALAAAYNMTAEWHPFYEEEIRRSFWYREGQNDNCLFTAVSGANQFGTAVCNPTFIRRNYPEFPLDDVNRVCENHFRSPIQNFKAKLGELAAVRPYLCDVQYTDRTRKVGLFTKATLAMFVVNGLVLDTSGVQVARDSGSYGEFALESIQYENFYGLVEVLRVQIFDKPSFGENEAFVMLKLREEPNRDFQTRLNQFAENVRASNQQWLNVAWGEVGRLHHSRIEWRGNGGFAARTYTPTIEWVYSTHDPRGLYHMSIDSRG